MVSVCLMVEKFVYRCLKKIDKRLFSFLTLKHYFTNTVKQKVYFKRPNSCNNDDHQVNL